MIHRLGVAAALSLLLCFLVSSAQTGSATKPSASQSMRPGYTGDDTCLSCHKTEATSYLHTAHHLTSQLPSAQSIHGKFQPGGNTLIIVE